MKSYADAGKLIDNYNYLPDDHFSVLGAAFQKWLAGEEDRAGLAQDIQDYWKTAMQGPPLPSCGGPYIPGTYGIHHETE